MLWSVSALFVRAGHADALVFTTWRLWFALAPLSILVLLRRRRNPELVLRAPGMSRIRWTLLVAGAGALFASSAATAFAALGLTRLLDVTLIGALQPVVIIALAVMFLGEHVDRGDAFALRDVAPGTRNPSRGRRTRKRGRRVAFPVARP